MIKYQLAKFKRWGIIKLGGYDPIRVNSFISQTNNYLRATYQNAPIYAVPWALGMVQTLGKLGLDAYLPSRQIGR